MKNKTRRALRLYPVYDALTGDLLFYSVIEILFLTLVKSFSDAQIALLFLISDVADLALEYPTYRLIRRIGNSKSIILGGVMPLISIILITVGNSLPVVLIGNILFVASGNFQSMACAAARNNLAILGEKENYAHLFSRSNIIYSAASIVAALICPILFSADKYLPSVICIIVYAGFAAISFLIPDYSENAFPKDGEKERTTSVKPAPVMKYIIAVFCMFFCTAAVFRTNSELLISRDLAALFSEHTGILLFGALKWMSKLLKLGVNVILTKIIDRFQDSIIVTGTVLLFVATGLTAIAALFFSGTAFGILICAVVYILITGVIWDPFRTFLRMLAVDTNSKQKQQYMLVMLNVGQSMLNAGMRLIVFITLKITTLEYVFVVFSVITAVEIILGARLSQLLKNNKTEISNIVGKLFPGEIDTVAVTVEQQLMDFGFENKQAIACRLLIENKLLEFLSGREGADISVQLSWEYGEIKARLTIGEERMDVLSSPGEDDFSRLIFGSVTGVLNLD